VRQPLAPGQSVTLTSAPAAFEAPYSIWTGSFATGTTDLYAYIDSWNPNVAAGAVAESDEGNNRVELRGLTVTGANQTSNNRRSVEAIPERPTLIASGD
jgi:hypothetical protein